MTLSDENHNLTYSPGERPKAYLSVFKCADFQSLRPQGASLAWVQSIHLEKWDFPREGKAVRVCGYGGSWGPQRTDSGNFASSTNPLAGSSQR